MHHLHRNVSVDYHVEQNAAIQQAPPMDPSQAYGVVEGHSQPQVCS